MSLVGLPSLVIIRRYAFIYSSCVTITLSKLPQLQFIDDYVIKGSRSLKTLTLEGLPKLEVIGANFANDCSSLEEVAFENCASLKVIGVRQHQVDPYARERGHSAVCDCDLLKSLAFKNLPALQGLECMADDCKLLEHVQFEDCPLLKSIGKGFARPSRKRSPALPPLVVRVSGCHHSTAVGENAAREVKAAFAPKSPTLELCDSC